MAESAAGRADRNDAIDGAERMTAAEFERASALVRRLTGIVIKAHKQEMMQSRLARRIRALGLPNYAAYLAMLESPEGANEIGEFVNAVTTNLTAFFRESHHFDHMRAHLLDAQAGTAAPRVRIWSSACSSGEEPYSIMMAVLNSKCADHPNLRVLATDLDTNMLARARSGRYPTERFEAAPKDLVSKATRVAPNGELEFHERIKAAITFNQLNLLGEWPMKGPFDAIFCRNVLIYFDADTKRRIVDRLAGLLRADGALYLGHSESLLGDHPDLVSEGRTIYRRRS